MQRSLLLSAVFLLAVISGIVFWWLRSTAPPPPTASPDQEPASVIDRLIAESQASNVPRAKGREAMALDTALPSRNQPPLIDYDKLQGDSHQKMLTALQQIRDRNLYETGFFGETPIDVREAELDQIADSDFQQRYNARMKLGMHRLWRGDTTLAIEHFQQAYTVVRGRDDQIPANVITGAAFQVGLAYMRKAEDENCVLCNNGESCLIPIQAGGVHQQTEGSENAILYLKQVLERDPQHVAARWLLNVASMTLGDYPAQVPSQFRIPPAAFDSEIDFPRFRNVASDRNVASVNLSGGVIWDDFDGDHDLDLITSSWDANQSLLFFRNTGDGQFVDASQEANFSGLFGGLNLIQADYDNDGDIDILVLRGAWSESNGRIPNSLLQNDGRGRFTDVTFDAGLADVNYPTQTAVWFDLENDGDLDLFVGNEKYPCQLFENQEGRFQDIAQGEAIRNFRFTKAVIAGDVNRDGLTDLYLSNHGQPNRLLINQGNGEFQDQAVAYGVEGPLMSFASWFWDYDNDGLLDLLVTGYSYGQTFVAENYFAEPTGKATLRLYRGTPTGFQDVTQDVKLDRVVQPMGCNFGDLDNDGFLDFYLGTGCPEYDTLMPNLMFRNQSGRSFADVTTAGGFGHLQKGHAIAFADFDQDGDQDIFAQMGGAYPGDAAANALYENPGQPDASEPKHWLSLKLIGTTSNRSAIGARITVHLTDDSGPRQIVRWVGSGGSFGANPLQQHVGLGHALKVDQVVIDWPATGNQQILSDLPWDRPVAIVEGEPGWRPLDPSNDPGNADQQP